MVGSLSLYPPGETLQPRGQLSGVAVMKPHSEVVATVKKVPAMVSIESL
jgi:hypothetical protein